MILLSLLLLACGQPDKSGSADSGPGSAADSGSGAAEGPGQLSLSFQMEEDLISSLDGPPVGTFGGSIFAEEDATGVGPNDGATSLEDLSVELDFSADAGPTATLHTTGPLDPGIVWVLGCLDIDGDGCGDPGDPITIPGENKVIVVGDAQTPFTVQMNLIRP